MNMRRQELDASWARTRRHLERAFAHLPESPVGGEQGGAVERYRSWLDHNELELALDELEFLGEANGMAGDFWQRLRDAALEMELIDHAERYRQSSNE